VHRLVLSLFEVPAPGAVGTLAIDRFSISMETQNILNHTNPGPIIGNITSPLFGHANQPDGGEGFGGFSEAANNRRPELQMRFTF
jgi:hypothetical protein